MPVDPLVQLKGKKRTVARDPTISAYDESYSITISLVTSAVCSFFSILTTAGRLYLRRAKFWWDDAFALLATVFLLVQIIAVFMHLPDPRETFAYHSTPKQLSTNNFY